MLFLMENTHCATARETEQNDFRHFTVARRTFITCFGVYFEITVDRRLHFSLRALVRTLRRGASVPPSSSFFPGQERGPASEWMLRSDNDW